MLLPTRNPDIVYQRVTEGAVLLSTRDEVYFGLDPVGSAIWELLPPTCETLDALCEALNARYPDVPPETIRGDAQELVAALLEAGLVIEQDGAASGNRGGSDPAR